MRVASLRTAVMAAPMPCSQASEALGRKSAWTLLRTPVTKEKGGDLHIWGGQWRLLETDEARAQSLVGPAESDGIH
ncbi:hypothetical protein NDU88_011069 [Pleurodeles waltl]|uniref:Uncharacterized protein n=1 Tax=Pleurodeles waltl TaxID=8319 RepID=A0AAV7S1G1_PLEWA|nr:hypothetical protein NDU88_011069 [Pleurodeles waltl]